MALNDSAVNRPLLGRTSDTDTCIRTLDANEPLWVPGANRDRSLLSKSINRRPEYIRWVVELHKLILIPDSHSHTTKHNNKTSTESTDTDYSNSINMSHKVNYLIVKTIVCINILY
jgi:hypothetical protein